MNQKRIEKIKTVKDLEQVLRDSGFSRRAATHLVKKAKLVLHPGTKAQKTKSLLTRIKFHPWWAYIQ